MKNIYEQGKSKYYKYSKRFRKPSDDGFHVPELKTTTSTTTPSSPATTKTSVSFATSISTSVSTSYKYSIQDHKKRLRKLLVPLPRHIAGPRPTISIPSPEVEDRERGARPPEEFLCPVFSRDSKSARNWRAFPDPSSCRHYYICLVQQSADLGDPVRHSCEEGRNFNKETETCDLIGDEGPRCGDHGDHGGTTRPRPSVRPVTSAVSDNKEKQGPGMSKEKQGLFVEFIQFLIRIGMFNKNTVISMLNNKDLFL